MSEEELKTQILDHLKGAGYRPLKPRTLAEQLNQAEDEGNYHAFRDALRDLMHSGRVMLGARGAVMLPGERTSTGGIVGNYRHNKRGFGFVVPTDPSGHEDLYIPEGQNAGALTGDVVRAVITNRGHRDGIADGPWRHRLGSRRWTGIHQCAGVDARPIVPHVARTSRCHRQSPRGWRPG